MFRNKPFFWAYVTIGAGFLCALALLAGLYYRQNGLFTDFLAESETRRDQSCTLFETAHKQDVDKLVNTYEYINSLKPKEIKETLNQFVIAGMPEQEQQARTDSAPDYCDEETESGKDVGLPEPDPVLPPLQDFSNLLIEK